MPRPAAAPSRREPAPAPTPAPPRGETNRELVEQIVVALILAYFLRGFQAEAFVIPTGSMATTLMGRHKEVACTQCGQVFTINAAEEVEGPGPPSRVIAGTCQNCRAPTLVETEPSFKGDRILVNKFLYDLPLPPDRGRPQRWDVVVFKYPEEPEVNYIKRLVGLPGEDLRVHHGDLLRRPLGTSEPFRYARRPLVHQRAMQMLVWDDAHRPAALAGKPEWRRWVPGSAQAWTDEAPDRSGRPWTYVSGPSGDAWTELHYRHMVPDPLQWYALLENQPLLNEPRPTLITDFYAYNTGVLKIQRGDNFNWFQPHWVGDLTLSCRLQPTQPSGRVRLDLVESGIVNRCEIDLATGLATLYHGGQQLGEPAQTGIDDTSAHDVEFANVDDRLTLWVDGRTPFGDGLAYADGSVDHPPPTEADLAPARIGSQGVPVKVSGLVLKRDIYYTLNPGDSDYDYYDPGSSTPPSRPFDFPGSPAERAVGKFDVLADPAKFPALGQLPSRDFAIRPGHYMMMGDNSPRSKDSRGWSTDDQLSEHPRSGWDPNPRESWEVPQALLIGKAFFVYWPHGVPFGPTLALNPDFRVPFRPYFERMRWIR